MKEFNTQNRLQYMLYKAGTSIVFIAVALA